MGRPLLKSDLIEADTVPPSFTEFKKAIFAAEERLEAAIETMTGNDYSIEDLPDLLKTDLSQELVNQLLLALQRFVWELKILQRHHPENEIWQIEKYEIFIRIFEVQNLIKFFLLHEEPLGFKAVL